MTILFLAVANGYDPGGVTVPGEIIDPTADDVILAFRDPFANTIPYADCTGEIATSYIVA